MGLWRDALEVILPLRIWIGKRLFGKVGSSPSRIIVRISPTRIIKWPCDPPELEAMSYVAANTDIPLPRLYRSYRWHGKLALEMEYIEGGKPLQSCWAELSVEQKREVVMNLSAYITQLRALKPAKNAGISSTEGGPCRDVRVSTWRLFGPFEDVASFHELIRGGMPIEASRDTFTDKVVDIHQRDYKVRFTHGDLNSLNVLIREGKIASIIDWECAGWYPEYWDYTKALYNMFRLPEFHEMLREKLDRYDAEFEAERFLWRWFDQPLDQQGA
ncbi:hypothetical protein KC336_g18299 [Hortaea werneckii]|nr:hypothetical protein KC336_g18299 [Hortaea werneckii]